MKVTTAWLKPPEKAGGVDHLGVQQTPTRIFSTLLPGITVVTDRVANYSFYPWVAWVHEKNKGRLALDFIHTLRRAECLLTLIAERHAQALGEHEVFHSRGLVGRNTLVPVLREGAPRPIPLAALAALRSENSESYFQNTYGGLGQYYLGSLTELDVLGRSGTTIRLTNIGVPLAEVFDARVDQDAFLGVLKRGSVNQTDLDRLAYFCPCNLASHAPERELLIDLLFARGIKPTPEAERRRHTLLLLLHLAARRGSLGDVALDAAFRAASLTGAFDDGSAWSPPEDWRRVQHAWTVYARNDALSIGLLGVFWVALTLLDEHEGQADSASGVGRLVSDAAGGFLKRRATTRVDEAIDAKRRSLPPISSWSDAGHEFQRSLEIRARARYGDTAECLQASLDTLLAIAARHIEPNPYRDIAIPSDYLSDYPLNLSSFYRKVTEDWGRLTLAQWAGALAVEWGIEAHLRVALRKMHYESQDKFLLYATDDGIRRRQGTEAPFPGFTASRIVQAVQFLVDLGLANWEAPSDDDTTFSGDWVARISKIGQRVREGLGG